MNIEPGRFGGIRDMEHLFPLWRMWFVFKEERAQSKGEESLA
jgi:hypothetical protein